MTHSLIRVSLKQTWLNTEDKNWENNAFEIIKHHIQKLWWFLKIDSWKYSDLESYGRNKTILITDTNHNHIKVNNKKSDIVYYMIKMRCLWYQNVKNWNVEKIMKYKCCCVFKLIDKKKKTSNAFVLCSYKPL